MNPNQIKLFDLNPVWKHRLYIEGVQVTTCGSLRYAKLALKIRGYTGDDWVVWYGTRQRPMSRLIACGNNKGSFSEALKQAQEAPRMSFRGQCKYMRR